MSVALVTGGSRGIGRAIVEEFADAGYSVAFTYSQDGEAAREIVARLEARGRRVIPHQADVRDFARAQQVAEEAEGALGPLDVLVNNAGIRLDGALHKMDPETWSEVIETNLTGTFNYTRALIRKMIRRGGSIINITSVSGVTGAAGQTNYSASKAGIIGFTKALSKEVARFGVRVNAVAPGLITTDMTESMSAAARKKLSAQIPLGKPGCPKDVAHLALYLAGPDAGYVTGQVFTVDGGMS